MTKISIFRTSFIWVQTVPAILGGQAAGQPYSFLGQYGGYAEAFDRAQSGKPAAGDLKLPWNSPQGNYYWRFYSEGKHAGDMTGVQAWKKFVPFQRELPCKVVSKDPAITFVFDAFYAPHGISLVARATYRGEPRTALEIAKLALEARYDYRFEIDGKTNLNLDQAADRALEYARRNGFGNVDGFPGDNQPFSVTTFLVGADVPPLTQGSDEHFLLETVAGWNRYLKQSDVAKLPLADAQVSIRGRDNENIMYARKQGRVIWLPRTFAQSPDTPKLACYHRNIAQASLQTLSLGEFISWVAAQHDEHLPVAREVDERAKRAVSLLQLFSEGKTASGKKVTYRTKSIPDQIKSAEWASAMAAIKALPEI